MKNSRCGVDLHWLPLGARGHSVRLNRRIFEAAVARLEGAGLVVAHRRRRGSRERVETIATVVGPHAEG
jgi:hypothetical protein